MHGIVHYTGASLLFLMGTLYMCLDTHLTKHMHPFHNAYVLYTVRLLLAVLATCSLVTSILSLKPSLG